jgi:hypothetical protein
MCGVSSCLRKLSLLLAPARSCCCSSSSAQVLSIPCSSTIYHFPILRVCRPAGCLQLSAVLFLLVAAAVAAAAPQCLQAFSTRQASKQPTQRSGWSNINHDAALQQHVGQEPAVAAGASKQQQQRKHTKAQSAAVSTTIACRTGCFVKISSFPAVKRG